VTATTTASSASAAAVETERLFAGPRSIRTPRERWTALALLVTVPVTLAVIGLVFHGITATQVALLFVGGMVFVSLARGRLLGSSIRVRREEFPNVVAIVERASRRLGIAPPQVFIRDDYLVPLNSLGLGEPYALVLSSQYLQLFTDDELAFMVGRELGHIAAGNTRLLSLINASGRTNPVVTSLFGGWIRQTEYTADRAGLLCTSLGAALKAIAVSTFHVSGRHVESAMLHDQRRDIESDFILRLGEVTANVPYAVNRVRALEAFAASDLYITWARRLDARPLPVRAALGPADGPVDRRETASNLRRWLAVAIDLILIGIIFHTAHVVHASVNSTDVTPPGTHAHVHVVVSRLDWHRWREYASDNSWLWYFVYAAGLVAIAGRTIGMMVLDLRVVGRNHERAGIAQSIWRYVLALGCTLTVLPLIYGWVRRVHLHDRWSRSYLIGNRTGLG
jgi:Zn-dependent protease with chaperone function